ncbi:transcriptional regulator domain-containing protein [Cedecea sp. MMO-103]|uniref:transcriptional regulator domain-containing protein n=1 Tax=Cedecea sp. MMO-103 TaxID=3081238 RepID=UPI0030175438
MYIDVAWECLRRNENYNECWALMKKDLGFLNNKYDRKAQFWGLTNFVDPQASSIDVFWIPALSKRTIYANKCKWNPHQSFMKIRSEIQFNECNISDNEFCTKLYDDQCCIQIITQGGLLFAEENYSLCFFIKSDDLDANIDILRFLYKGNVTLFPKGMRNILDCLVFYDLYKNGMSHKEIAKLKYPQYYSDEEWLVSDWLRARVRYKIKKATKYINGFYINLL